MGQQRYNTLFSEKMLGVFANFFKKFFFVSIGRKIMPEMAEFRENGKALPRFAAWPSRFAYFIPPDPDSGIPARSILLPARPDFFPDGILW